MTPWVQVLVTMADGPKVPISGLVRAIRQDPSPKRSGVVTYGVSPVPVCLGTDEVRLLRHGRKARIENPATGAPLFISDGETGWRFDSVHDEPVATSISNILLRGPGKELVVTRPAHNWVAGPFRKPIGPVLDTELLGRRCWTVELDSGRVGRASIQLVIDTETGTVLSQNSTDGTDTASFLDLEVRRDDFDPDPFTWTGPVRSPRDLGKEHLARENEKQRRGQAWFRHGVTDLPVTASVPVTFTPTEIRTFDEETGAFEAMFAKGLGTLWRRPRSEQTWYLPLRGARNFPIAWSAWSTTAFDWACGLDLPEGSLTTGTITALQQQLHPYDQVTGEPPIG